MTEPTSDASSSEGARRPKRKRCKDFCPPGFTGHWREWHRGHGCHLDDGKPPALSPLQETTDPHSDVARLRELAYPEAKRRHNQDRDRELSSNGDPLKPTDLHPGRFEECPQADCRLVRAASAKAETTDPRIAEMTGELREHCSTRPYRCDSDAWFNDPKPPRCTICRAADALTVLQQQLDARTGERDEANRQLKVANDTVDALIPKLDDAEQQCGWALRLADGRDAILCRTSDALTGDNPLDADALSCPLVRLAADVKAELDALRAAREALQVIHTAVRGDEKSECWTIRKWLDEHGVFNDDLEGSDRLVEAVCDFVLRAAAPEKGGQ